MRHECGEFATKPLTHHFPHSTPKQRCPTAPTPPTRFGSLTLTLLLCVVLPWALRCLPVTPSPCCSPTRLGSLRTALQQLKAKYLYERDRRMRTDGTAQYVVIGEGKGEKYADWLKDPWCEPVERDPVVCCYGGYYQFFGY